jgi:hypothetical protein
MSPFHHPARVFHRFLQIPLGLPERFSRGRIWSPRSVLIWLLVLTFPDRRMAYRKTLWLLEPWGARLLGWARRPSPASICVARRKLSVAMCRSALHAVVRECERVLGPGRHSHGERRFIAIDGTRLVTRRSTDTARWLTRYRRPNGEKVHHPQGLMVSAVDVMRRLPLDWIVVGKGKSERTALIGLLETLRLVRGDVVIMDRGFASRQRFGALLELGVDIVARMSTSEVNAWTEVAEFVASGSKNAIITVNVGERSDPVLIRARLVERDRRSGRPRKGTTSERMVILTTLTEEDGFSRQEVIDIYAARWGIESIFKELKVFMGVEPFHSTTVSGCEQEVAASLIWMAFAAFLQGEAERTLEDRKVYRSDCLRHAHDLVMLILNDRPFDDEMRRAIRDLRDFSYKPRPGRHYPRECKMPFGRSVQRGIAK